MSATLTPELNALKRVVLHSPAVLKLEEDDGEKSAGKTEGGNLSQFYLNLPKRDKTLVIYVFLKVGCRFIFTFANSWLSLIHLPSLMI